MGAGSTFSSAMICGAGFKAGTRVPCQTATTAIPPTPATANPATTGRRSHSQKRNVPCRGIQRAQQLRPRCRIAQQIAQRLLAGQRVEQLLIFQRGGKQRLLLFRGQRAGGVSAQQFLDLFRAHGLGGSQLPPMASNRFFRQR